MNTVQVHSPTAQTHGDKRNSIVGDFQRLRSALREKLKSSVAQRAPSQGNAGDTQVHVPLIQDSVTSFQCSGTPAPEAAESWRSTLDEVSQASCESILTGAQVQLQEILSKYKEFSRTLGEVGLDAEVDIPGLSRQLCLGQSPNVQPHLCGLRTPGPKHTARTNSHLSNSPPSATSLWRQAASQWQQASSQWNETSKVTPSLRRICLTDSPRGDGTALFSCSSPCQESHDTPLFTGGLNDACKRSACMNFSGDSVCNARSPDQTQFLGASMDYPALCAKFEDRSLTADGVVGSPQVMSCNM